MDLLEWMTNEAAGSPVQESFAEPQKGFEMRFLRGGSGEPVLLLHGLLGAAEIWQKLIPSLMREHSVFALDQLVSVHHGWVMPQSAQILDTTERLASFMDSVGVKRAHLIGHSYGGSVAMVFAARFPERVASLTLIAPATGYSTSLQPILRFWRTPLGAWLAHRVVSVPKHLKELALTRMYGHPEHVDERILETYVSSLRRPGAVDHVLSVVQQWDKNMAVVDAAMMYLKTIPVLLLWGDSDRTAGLGVASQVLKRLPHAELHIFPDAGHLLFDELPHETNEVLRDWLARTPVEAEMDEERSQVA